MSSPFLFDQPTTTFNFSTVQMRLISTSLHKVAESTKENQSISTNSCCSNLQIMNPKEKMHLQTVADMDSPMSNSSSDEEDLIMQESKPSKSLNLNLNLNLNKNCCSSCSDHLTDRLYSPCLNGFSRGSSRSNTPQKFLFAKPITSTATPVADKILRAETKKKLKNFRNFQNTRNLRIQLPQRRKEKLRCPCPTPTDERNSDNAKHFVSVSTKSASPLFFQKPTSS